MLRANQIAGFICDFKLGTIKLVMIIYRHQILMAFTQLEIICPRAFFNFIKGSLLNPKAQNLKKIMV